MANNIELLSHTVMGFYQFKFIKWPFVGCVNSIHRKYDQSLNLLNFDVFLLLIASDDTIIIFIVGLHLERSHKDILAPTFGIATSPYEAKPSFKMNCKGAFREIHFCNF